MALNNNVCRCCMLAEIDSNGDTTEMFSIFSKLDDDLIIKELLLEAIPRLEFAQNDRLPKKICMNCTEAIKEIYQFQQNCIRNEAKFKEILMVKNEKPIVNNVEYTEAAYFEDIITKIDAEDLPLADYYAHDNASPAAEKQKLNIDKIEEELHSDEADDFIASCSDFSLDIPDACLSNESDTNNQGNAGNKSLKNKSQKEYESKKNKLKLEKDEATNSNQQSLNTVYMDTEYLTDVEDIVESDFSLDLNESDADECTDKKSSKRKKVLKNANHEKSIRKPTKIVLFSCNKCEKHFKSDMALLKHVEMHRKLVCNVCEEEFMHKELLRAHKKMHATEETHLCSECGKSFATANILRIHTQRHLDEKQYTCQHCPKSFRTSADLYSHIRIHNLNTKLHTCDECGKSFIRSFLLKQHRLRHTNIKNFQCEFCEKKFFVNEQLQRHRRIHTGEKPYKCKFCERAYVQTNDLIKHVRTHLGENVYQCELCPQRFPTAKACREHFTLHKNDDEETRVQLLAQLNALEVKGLFCK